MRRRTIFFIFTAVICGIVLGLFLFSQTEGSRQYAKNLIERRLNSIPNFHISLGDIEGSVISTLEISDIEVKIAGESHMKIEKLSTNYSIPLLYSMISRKKLYLSDTEIQGLRVFLAKDRRGVWDFKKLKNEDKTAEGPQGERISLIFANNRIRDSRVTIVDRTRDKVWEFDLVEESLFSINIIELTKKIELDAKDMNFDYVSPRIRIRNLKGKIDIASWDCVFKDAGFKVEGVPVRGSGVARGLRNPEFDMTVYFDTLGINGKGEINLKAKTKVKMHSLDNMVGTMELSTPDSFLNGKPFRMDLRPVTIKGTKTFIEGTAGGGFGESSLRGSIDFRKWLAGGEKNWFDLTAELSGANTDELTEILNRTPYPLKFGDNPRLNSNLRVSGSWASREIYSLRIEPDYLDVIDSEQSSLRIEGYMTFRNDGTDFDFTSKAKGFKLKLEFPDITIDNHVDGNATFKGAIPKKGKFFEDKYLRVNADLKTDELYGITSINSRIDGSIQKGTLTVNRLKVLSDQFSLSAEKTKGAQKGLDCVFEFKTQDLSFLSEIDERIPLVLGKIDSSGKISGDIFTPLIEANSRVEDFAYEEDFIAQEMSVRSSTRIDLKNTPKVSLDIYLLGERARVLGNYSDTIEAKLRGTETLFDAGVLLSKKNGSYASSEFSVSDLLEDEKKLRMTYLEGLLDEKLFKNKGDIFLDISSDRASIRGDEFLYGEGKISDFLGEIDRKEKTIELRAEITNFNPLIISKVLNFRHDLGGTLNGKVRASGSLTAPSVQAEIRSEGFSYGFPASGDMKIRLDGEKGKLSLDLLSSLEQKENLSLRGDLLVPRNAQSPLEAIMGTSIDLELKSDGYGLGFMEIFSNSIEKIDGDFSSGSLSLNGTLSRPRVKGNLELNGMRLSLAQLRNSLFTEHAKLSLSGTKLSLPRTEILSKQGRAYLKGRMDISDFTYRANLEMEKVRFNPHSIKTDLSGDLKIEKKGEFLKVTGKTKVTAGRIRLYPGRIKSIRDISFIEKTESLADEFSLEAQNETGFYREKTAMDISVDISSGTWIKTKEANFNTRGKLRLKKEPGGDLNMQGNIVSSEGYYTVFGKLFDIEDATLNFTGASNNPDLNVKAYYDADDVDVYVNVTGDLREPDLSLSSTPDLEEIDIISYIVFGASSNRLQNQQRAFVGKFATAVATGGISELLSSEIGLDLLSIQEGDRGFEDSTLKVGSYVTRDIFVGYERSPSKTSLDHTVEMRNKLNLEWRLNRRFSIESQMGGENPGVDFFYNFNY
ncbi:MAG: translocation/assembly module TamB [Candidatus Dadabacteria bacterium]|nr:translocation/assembly module TamB [Candidatus Dadabacteria bacterium]